MNDASFLLALAGFLALGGLLAIAVQLYIRKHVVGGFGWLERRRLHREGTPGRALVIDFIRLPRYFVAEEYDVLRLVLEVAPQGAPSFRASLEVTWQDWKWGLMNTGRVLPVLCGGGRVMLDRPALVRETAAARAAALTAAEERQRRLLDDR